MADPPPKMSMLPMTDDRQRDEIVVSVADEISMPGVDEHDVKLDADVTKEQAVNMPDEPEINND